MSLRHHHAHEVEIRQPSESCSSHVPEGMSENDMGLTLCTPQRKLEYDKPSPFTKQGVNAVDWQVYSRRKGYRKQKVLGYEEGASSHAVFTLHHSSPKEQHQPCNNVTGSAREITTEPAEDTNNTRSISGYKPEQISASRDNGAMGSSKTFGGNRRSRK